MKTYQIYCDRGNGNELDGCWGSEEARFDTRGAAEEAATGLEKMYPDCTWNVEEEDDDEKAESAVQAVMEPYRVTDEVTSENHNAETPVAAVEQFLDVGYNTGDLANGAEFKGNVWDADGVAVATWFALADGDGGVKGFTVTTY